MPAARAEVLAEVTRLALEGRRGPDGRMPALAVETLGFCKRLEAGGIPRAQAEAFTYALRDTLADANATE